MAIAAEGLANSWGSQVGKTILEQGHSLYSRMIASAAAGSDARMNGCALPVVINSGSGNQGITASVPVAEYAKAKGMAQEQLLRALCVSNLISIHQKARIGKLSAYCGATSAAVGSSCAIAYLEGADYACICRTINNSLGCIAGMLCDGAKSSCAAKIASALDTALRGYELAKRGLGFLDGEGIVCANAEQTIDHISNVVVNGMRETDKEILRIMTSN